MSLNNPSNSIFSETFCSFFRTQSSNFRFSMTIRIGCSHSFLFSFLQPFCCAASCVLVLITEWLVRRVWWGKHWGRSDVEDLRIINLWFFVKCAVLRIFLIFYNDKLKINFALINFIKRIIFLKVWFFC